VNLLALLRTCPARLPSFLAAALSCGVLPSAPGAAADVALDRLVDQAVATSLRRLERSVVEVGDRSRFPSSSTS
jgi:hypothetical protein